MSPWNETLNLYLALIEYGTEFCRKIYVQATSEVSIFDILTKFVLVEEKQNCFDPFLVEHLISELSITNSLR